MGVSEQQLQHWSHDGGGCLSLPHHHCHVAGMKLSRSGLCDFYFIFLILSVLCEPDHNFFFAGQQDCGPEAL